MVKKRLRKALVGSFLWVFRHFGDFPVRNQKIRVSSHPFAVKNSLLFPVGPKSVGTFFLSPHQLPSLYSRKLWRLLPSMRMIAFALLLVPVSSLYQMNSFRVLS